MSEEGQSAYAELGPNDWYIAHMFEMFTADPRSVDDSWREYFEANPQVGPKSLESLDRGLSGTLSEAGQTSEAVPSTELAFNASDLDPSSPVPTATPAVRPHDELVTRSDLPPAPTPKINEATSPYVRAHQQSLRLSRRTTSNEEDETIVLRGAGRAVAKNMEASLAVPTATSARDIPAKLMIENRYVINSHLAHTVGGKVSFTHLLGYALVEALAELPKLNVRYTQKDGKPAVEELAHVGLGIAVDIPKDDGSRSLLVPVVRNADTLTFLEFVAAMNDLISRAREGQLTAEDFQGATVSLTNPGTLGTTHSVPRLMSGQGVIIGIGATDYPAEWAGVSPKRLAELGVGKTMYATSTYDHRVIQGADSGTLLRKFADKLGGKDDFYDRVFDALEIPYPPYRWEADRVYDISQEKGKQSRTTELIHAYRSRGHLAADTDPLAYRVRRHPDLELGRYGLTVWDLDRTFPTGGFGGSSQMVLRDLLQRLRDTYTRSVGIEYMHIQDPAQRLWVQEQIEAPYQKPSSEEQKQILSTLVHAEAFEEFLQTKFVGQKRFSLEGGESLIPLLDTVMYDAAEAGLAEVTIGMAHRGRLNVLANIAGKSYSQIFSEFEGSEHMRGTRGSGDVKYHLGTEGVYSAGDGLATKVYLAANPSHLEAVDGVLLGITRAKDDLLGDPTWPVLPVLVHGDAAFIGQGVVYECLNMSQLEGFRTGGTLHVIINNQIGFTTAPTAGRSTRYPTDLAKGMQVPIFHVNADDPEAVVRAARLAFRYREEFNKDVIIDLVCYRRRGHNEGDDPSMTQPLMYRLIDELPSTRAVYTSNLIGRGDISQDEANQFLQDYEVQLAKILEETRERGGIPDRQTAASQASSTDPHYPVAERHGLEVPESQLPGSGMMIGWTSAVSPQELERIGEAYTSLPEGFTPHRKLEQLSQRRLAMSRGETPIDWGFAELLAWGTMLMDGTPVRISGQDSRRATFVQRHAVLHDQVDGREFTPLNFLTEDQAGFQIYDSPLSEYAPLAFEYGYSVERPDMFVAWEAQFGDFVNGAQTVVDEFISSAGQKWGQATSMVMMLPHGYEGQGPDHSSSRMERYLQLAAEENFWVAQPSTPANHFHLLRTQAYRRPRSPLIEITPKQLLRLSAASSSREEFIRGEFLPVIGETNPDVTANANSVRKVLICTGRVYYDLAKQREKLGASDVAIVRVERLYPLPVEELILALEPFSNAEWVWVQDEPENQGAWPFMALNLFPLLGKVPLTSAAIASGKIPRCPTVSVVSRDAAASPATGLGWRHREEAASILDRSFM
ncbi:multifunctional oxoglutarate decarboxylase/oxoglutarate dehydrogenase thiamine pyrophosphate-binding subunit/dihydrolipoyllysine-residue succinyltransferase subunit [Actinomycetaceae bacterium MB13-C1-2]|nr:multifunctional oxoglutarate decarboxylase/oxoglutarate dehydrogenase thiamine pyrophosphate-binding subunit/dihydrolipoyllysine-residue succinyltransferase subunit [Actinomycetaceae bacterium MB13-C1-2]